MTGPKGADEMWCCSGASSTGYQALFSTSPGRVRSRVHQRRFLPLSSREVQEPNLVGVKLVDFVTGGEKSPVLRILRRVSETKEKLEIREFRAKNEDGIEFWVNWSAIPIENGTGRPDLLVMIQENVTERKRVEEVLKESEEKFSRRFPRFLSFDLHHAFERRQDHSRE